MDLSNIHRYVYIGRNQCNWYDECRDCFVELFGHGELELVCKLFAATSINTSLKSNITLFRKAYYEFKNNLPVSDKYLPNIKNQLLLIRDDKPLSGRKINNFSLAMYGDPNAVVVDVWITRAFGFEKKRLLKGGRIGYSSPTKKQYDLIENWMKAESMKMGLQPRQLCAIIWAGIRTESTGDAETNYTNILKSKLVNLFGCI